MNIKDNIFQFVSEKIKLIIALFFTTLFSILFSITSIITFADLVEELFVKKNYEALPIRITIMVISIILSFVLSIAKTKQFSNLGNYISSNLAKQAYSSMLHAEITDIEKEEVREAISNIVVNSEKIGSSYISNNILPIFEKIMYIFITFITLLVVKPAFALIAFIGLPFFFAIEKGLEKLLVIFVNKKDSLSIVNSNKISESFQKIRDIKLENSIKYEEEEFSKIVKNYTDATERRDVTVGLVKHLMENFFSTIIIMIIIGIGGWLVGSEKLGITSKVLLVFVLVVPTIYAEFRRIMKLHFLPSSIAKEVSELEMVINLKSEIKTEPINNLDEILNFKFEDVTYINSNKKKIFEKVSFELKRGEKIGILSVDKEFKDSIFNIITKMSKPNSGIVSINNCDTNKINTSYLRDLITSVYDESTIIDDTIIKNISYPLKFDDYKYNDALNRTGLKEMIAELPKKENTILNKDADLSKDFIDRVIFANAFYKDSKIYLLKDATKDYPLNTESELLSEIFKLKNKIIILMTDKVYNLVGCDKVLIFENGEVIEYGKYSELLQDKTSRLYKVMRKSSSISKEKKIG